MTRRERLTATLRGEPVDRPAVSFYEIGGWKLDPENSDPYNIYNASEWRHVIELAESETDIIRMTGPDPRPTTENCRDEFFSTDTWETGGSRFSRTTINVAGRTLTSQTKRDQAINTTWSIEHLLKNADDARAYLELPDEVFAYEYDITRIFREEREIGDSGIAMLNVGDPLCVAAELFSMEDYTVIALTEPSLFHELLEQASKRIYPMVEFVAQAAPAKLWRIVGSEFGSEPYLPPRLYQEYWYRYTVPIIMAIHKYDGYARVHSHGRLKNILPFIAKAGADGMDPIEPPPQGDVELIEVRKEYGSDMVLFGNIEASDIEILPPNEFEKKVQKALKEGTIGNGRGFVLHPSACPYGRELSPYTVPNYETMIRCANNFGG